MATKKPVTAASGAAPTSLDVEALRQIVEILESSEVTSLTWTNGKEKMSIRRGAPQVTQVVQHVSAAAPTPAVSVMPPHHSPSTGLAPRASAPVRAPAADGGEKKGHVITSPFVGTFYRSPAPDQPSFCEVGSQVKKGQVLCIVEAMKLMNEIESEMAGKVTECLVQNAQPVEFGQPLFRIEP
jgi:acetyl-CoA carboxylase biotin carboxyl carrier protein